MSFLRRGVHGLGSRVWQGLAGKAGCVACGPAPKAMQHPGTGLPSLSWRPFSSKQPSPTEQSASKSKEQAAYLLALAVALVGATYGAVPLYRMFCATTGYGGTVQEGATVEAKLREREENPNPEVEAAAAARTLTVSFNADVSDGMPWRFVPTQRSIKVHPGQSALAFYTATNMSDKAITGVSTYNVAPMQAGVYFNKIQCFCFEEQKLRPGESIDMPVFFYVDPEYATDPRLQHINALTLSYTFFQVAEEEVAPGDQAHQALQTPALGLVPASS